MPAATDCACISLAHSGSRTVSRKITSAVSMMAAMTAKYAV